MRIGVIGGGTMGIGIVHSFATTGTEVILVEQSASRAEAAMHTLRGVLDNGVSRAKTTAEEADRAYGLVSAITEVSSLPESLDLIVEAVPEIPDLKREILAGAEARKPAILGTNTSSISVDQLATGIEHPERFLGIHYFNPVWAKALVEIIVGSATDPEVVTKVKDVLALTNKQAITVRDSPGFASSRLGVLLGLEAMRMVEDGVASAEDIDTAMTLGYGHPMGPLRLTDLVGLDVRLDIARNLELTYGDRFTPPKILEEKVAAGQLGNKTGQGFFTW